MNKVEASKVLKCDPCDVDAIMGRYGMSAIGSVNGRGGGYFPGIVRKVAEYETYKAQLEAEIVAKINEEIRTRPLGTMFLIRQIANDLAKIEDAPISREDCLRRFVERTEA